MAPPGMRSSISMVIIIITILNLFNLIRPRKAIPMYSMTLLQNWACRRSCGRLETCMAWTATCSPWCHVQHWPSSCSFPSQQTQRQPNNKVLLLQRHLLLPTHMVYTSKHMVYTSKHMVYTSILHTPHRGGAGASTGPNREQTRLLHQADHRQRMWHHCLVACSGQQPPCPFPWYVYHTIPCILCVLLTIPCMLCVSHHSLHALCITPFLACSVYCTIPCVLYAACSLQTLQYV